jgi:hypothetical protein
MHPQRLLPLSLLLALSGCATLGLSPAQNLDQKIGYAYGGVTAALQTIAQATTAGTLTSTKATNANNMVLNIKSILDSAKATETTNASAAAIDLQLATTALTAVQAYFTANGVK